MKQGPAHVVQSDGQTLEFPIPDGAHRFAAAMQTRPREVWLKGPTQFDFYDNPAVIDRAAREAAAHFKATLRPAGLLRE